jgi:hypothetical protein
VTNDQAVLLKLAASDELLEVGRKAIEDKLIEFRDERLSTLRNNGFTVREFDGSASSIIRFGPEVGLRIALKAIVEHLKKEEVSNVK